MLCEFPFNICCFPPFVHSFGLCSLLCAALIALPLFLLRFSASLCFYVGHSYVEPMRLSSLLRPCPFLCFFLLRCSICLYVLLGTKVRACSCRPYCERCLLPLSFFRTPTECLRLFLLCLWIRVVDIHWLTIWSTKGGFSLRYVCYLFMSSNVSSHPGLGVPLLPFNYRALPPFKFSSLVSLCVHPLLLLIYLPTF